MGLTTPSRLPTRVCEIFRIKRGKGRPVLSCDPGAQLRLQSTVSGPWRLFLPHEVCLALGDAGLLVPHKPVCVQPGAAFLTANGVESTFVE